MKHTEQETCRCNAYPFPHRMGGGKCNVEFINDPVCESCGYNCTAKKFDEGIGPYEFWGCKGVHHDYRVGSSCCHAEIIDPRTGDVWEDKSNLIPTREEILNL